MNLHLKEAEEAGYRGAGIVREVVLVGRAVAERTVMDYAASPRSAT